MNKGILAKQNYIPKYFTNLIWFSPVTKMMEFDSGMPAP
jgi:hypothetical protein